MRVLAARARYWDVVAARLSALVYRAPLDDEQRRSHDSFWGSPWATR